MEPLAAILSSSASLLSLLSAPPPLEPLISTASDLASARARNDALRDQLARALDVGTARRKAKQVAVDQRGEGGDAREEKLKARADELRVELEDCRGVKEVRRKVVGVLNSSWVVVSHLNRVSEPTERDLAFQSLLEKRDIYALSLLRLRAQTDAVQSSRNIARKRLLLLNRSNSESVAILRHSNVEERVIAGMSKDSRRQHTNILMETTTLLSRHAIIRNVFQLIVAESGIEWFGDQQLEKLMVEAGEGWVDRSITEDVVEPAKGQGKGKKRGRVE